MGSHKHYSPQEVKLRKSQANRIKPSSQGGEWYAKVDPVTGAIQWLRKKVKERK